MRRPAVLEPGLMSESQCWNALELRLSLLRNDQWQTMHTYRERQLLAVEAEQLARELRKRGTQLTLAS